jgi:hypothetical protein
MDTTLSATRPASLEDLDVELANATANWAERAKTHHSLATEIREARDARLVTLGGAKETRRRYWAAEEVKALEHDAACDTWSERIKVATQDRLLLDSGDLTFSAEFAPLFKAALKAGRIRLGDRRQGPQPAFTLSPPEDL